MRIYLTQHPNVQVFLKDSFEEVADETYSLPKAEKGSKTSHNNEMLKSIKAPFTNSNQHARSGSERKSLWIIGSDEDASHSNNRRKDCLVSLGFSKKCSRLSSFETAGLANTLAVIAGVPNIKTAMAAKTVTTDSHRQVTSTVVDAHHITKPTLINKNKKNAEPIADLVRAPITSDCEDCILSSKQNVPLLPTPSLERLLPIGATKTPGKIVKK